MFSVAGAAARLRAAANILIPRFVRLQFCSAVPFWILPRVSRSAGRRGKPASREGGERDREATVYWSACISANGLARFAPDQRYYKRAAKLPATSSFHLSLLVVFFPFESKRSSEIINSRLIRDARHLPTRRGFRALLRSIESPVASLFV